MDRARLTRGFIVALGTATMLAAPAISQSPDERTVPEGTQASARPWMNPALDADARARLLLAALTIDEKIALVHGSLGRPRPGFPNVPAGAMGTAGYVPGVPRLGIPALQETDAGVGVTNPDNARPGDGATALPATIATAASWDRALAYTSGVVLGDETRRKGFNVMLAGGANLMREPRNGRNFEYLGEDPLLTGLLAGDTVRGIQSQNVVSTVKHFAFNNQETGRFLMDVRIGEAAARESDLLAFQIAIETGDPASVMCAYNAFEAHYTCGSDWLLNDVLKKDWAFPGWVMSDWGAVHDTDFALKGLDQQSGEQLDHGRYFAEPLRERAGKDPVYAARLDDMVRRILRSLFAVGLMDRPVARSAIDYAAHARASQSVAEEGAVLLKNAGNLLPLAGVRRVAVIGGMAEFGVIAGGGSSYTTAIEGPGIQLPAMGVRSTGGAPRMRIYHPSSPLEALREQLPGVEFSVDEGAYPSAAARAAKGADVVIVFATQWATETADVPDLSLPNGQDAVIAAVAAANPRTIVVLETGGPVLMPWLPQVGAVLEAWYPGGRGGQAIANLLTGRVNPSGRLPITFPASAAQLPRSVIAGMDLPVGRAPAGTPPVPLPYVEGADVGYRWFARRGHKPLFPFGHGLSYTSFVYSDLKVVADRSPRVMVTVRNTGKAAGSDVPQVYLTNVAGRAERRLLGWERVSLRPGEARTVTIAVDPRLLARFDVPSRSWRLAAGRYGVMVGRSVDDGVLNADVVLEGATWKP